MFRVTRAEEQAVRLIMRMALIAKQVTLGELAESEDLPEPTVAKLLGMLRRKGVVEAVRGRNGGYVLGKEPAAISIAWVIRSVTRETVFDYPCQKHNSDSDCPRTGDCSLRQVWQHLEDRVSTALQQTSIADLTRPENTVSRNLKELWP